VDMVHEQDVDVDLDFAPADDHNVEPPLDDTKDRVIIRITGVTVDWLVKVALKVYALYVVTNSKGINSLLVECYNAIYGTMVKGLLYYRKFSSSLKNRGFMSPRGQGQIFTTSRQRGFMSPRGQGQIYPLALRS
jgi:hypothetical protein